MQLPFDGHVRRRLYLVRHGQSAARSSADTIYGDTIRLTETGEAEARAMRDLLAAVPFDQAFCSDIRRAQETAAIILESRGLTAEPSDRFTEMRGDLGAALAADLPVAQKQAGFAYSMWAASEPGARFFGGDLVSEYLARTAATLSDLVRTSTADTILIVSHSGFQRAALCWVLDAVPLGVAKFEQDSCCLNILDIDVSADGEIVRKHLRLANFTPLDPVKLDARLTDGERLAVRLLDQLNRLAAGQAP
jgi:probable phosphoglycerate mutase